MLIDQIKENSFILKKARSRLYPTETITDADNADDIELLANTSAQAEFLLHNLEQTSGGIGLDMNTTKTENMCLKSEGVISTKISRQVYITRQQYLIFWKWC